MTEIQRPESLDEALAFRAAHPDAMAVAGGTDVLVGLNFRHIEPLKILDLSGLEELRGIDAGRDAVRFGAGVTYTEILERREEGLESLAVAARTVGSPQIRNRGTIGGNLGTASPAGDCHPVLLALGAEVEVASHRGSRRISIDKFFVAPGRSLLGDDELITAVHVPRVRGGQEFTKIGQRNAMIISACSFAVAIDPLRRRVGTGIGSAGPTPLRAREAEDFAAGLLAEKEDWESPRFSDAELAEFGSLVAAAARPIDDVRATAAYRRHALGVVGRRCLAWTGGAKKGADEAWT